MSPPLEEAWPDDPAAEDVWPDDPVAGVSEAFSQVDETDRKQEEAFLRYQAANVDSANSARIAEARQYWVAKPHYELDYIVKNLEKVRDEARAENIPWDVVRAEHPVLAKYIRDSTTATLALQDSAALTGWQRIIGGFGTVLGPDGKPDEKWVWSPTVQVAIDAFRKNLPATLAGTAQMIADIREANRTAFYSDEALKSLKLSSEEKKSSLRFASEFWAKTASRLSRDTTSTRDYRGPVLEGNRVGRAVESGLSYVAEATPIILASAATGGAAAAGLEGTAAVSAATRAMFWLNTAYAAPDIYTSTKEKTDSTAAALGFTAVGAPILGKLGSFSPLNNAVGASLYRTVELGVGRAAVKALESRSWGQLISVAAKKGGLDYVAGILANTAQGAASAVIDESASVWAGGEFNQEAVERAAQRGFQDGTRAIFLSMYGTGHSLVRDVGQMSRAKNMADNLDRLVDSVQKSKSALEDPALHEEILKDIASQPGGDSALHLPIDKLQDLLQSQGFDPRAVVAEVYGDSGAAYDAALQNHVQFLEIPIEKTHKVVKSKVLSEFVQMEGTLDSEIMSRSEAVKFSDEFNEALKAGLKEKPDQMSPEDVGVFTALKEFAKSDEAVAQQMFGTLRAIQAHHPELTLSQIYDATWGDGGLYGPPGQPSTLKVDQILESGSRESGVADVKPEVQKLMDEEGSAEYASLADLAKAVAKERLESVLKPDFKGKPKNFIETERARFETEAVQKLKSDPNQRVLHFFETGELWGDASNREILLGDDGQPLRLLAAEVDALAGAGTAELLKQRRSKLITNNPDKSADVNIAAQLLGFESADPVLGEQSAGLRLINGLLSALPENQFVGEYTKLRVDELHRSSLLDDPRALVEKVLDSVHNEKAALKVLKEYRAIAGKLDPAYQARSLMTPEMWEARAKRILDNRTIKDLKPSVFSRAAKYASGRAINALSEKNYSRAFDATEAQLLNHYLYKESRARSERLNTLWDKVVFEAKGKEWRGQLGLASETYRNLNDELLKALGVTESPLGLDPSVLDNFVRESEAFGQIPEQMDVELLRDVLKSGATWEKLTFSEAEKVTESLALIRKMAEERNVIRLGTEKFNYETRAGEILSELRFDPGVKPELRLNKNNKGRLERFRTIKDSLSESWTDVPTLFEITGSNKFTDTVLGGYYDARAAERSLTKELVAPYLDLFEKFTGTKASKARFNEVLPRLNEMLKSDRITFKQPLTRGSLLNMLGWMGTESGRNKLLTAFGWTPEKVFNAAGEFLTPAEINTLQEIFDFNDKVIWPKVEEKFKAINGLPPRKELALGFQINFADGSKAEFRGGFMPVRWDLEAGKSPSGVTERAQVQMTADNLSYNRVATFKNYLKARTKYVGVPDLDWGSMPSHINEVVHDLAYDNFIHNSARLLTDQRISDALTQRAGPERIKQLKAFIAHVARGQETVVPSHLKGVVDATGWARNKITLSTMAYNVSNAVADFAQPLRVAIKGDVKASELGAALTTSLVAGKATRDFALVNSEVMRYRADNDYQVLRDALTETTQERKGLRRLTEPMGQYAFFFHHTVDNMVSTLLWTAKYNQELKASKGNHAEAVKRADKMVELVMPTQDKNLRASLIRDTKGIGSVLMLMSWNSKLHSIRRQELQKIADMWEVNPPQTYLDKVGTAGMTVIGYAKIAAMMAVPAMVEAILMGRGPDDDETTEQWIARQALQSQYNMYPGVSEIMDIVISGLDLPKAARRVNPLTSPVISFAERIHDRLGRLADSDKDGYAKAAALAELLMLGTDVPGSGQVSKTGEYAARLLGGDVNPRDVGDVAKGLVYGTPRELR